MTIEELKKKYAGNGGNDEESFEDDEDDESYEQEEEEEDDEIDEADDFPEGTSLSTYTMTAHTLALSNAPEAANEGQERRRTLQIRACTSSC